MVRIGANLSVCLLLVSSAGHRNLCTEVKIRNCHSSCTLSIFERVCHRQSKVLLHLRDVLSLYQSNGGAPTKPLSHFLKFPYTYVLLQTYAGYPACTCWCIWQFHLRVWCHIHDFQICLKFCRCVSGMICRPGLFFTIFFPLVLALGAICVFFHIVCLSLPI